MNPILNLPVYLEIWIYATFCVQYVDPFQSTAFTSGGRTSVKYILIN